MRVERALPLALGTLAVASGAALITFDVIFAVTLSGEPQVPENARITAIVASCVGSATVGLLSMLLGREIRYRNGGHIQDFGRGRQHTYLLTGFGGVFWMLSEVASALVLGIMEHRVSELPKTIINSSTKSIIAGGFVVWTITLLSQAIFLICMVILQQRDVRNHSFRSSEPASEMQQTTKEKKSISTASSSMDSKSPPSSSGHSRSGSGSMGSFRSSISHVVRPVTSKTKLVSHKPPHRPASINLSHREAKSMEDGGWEAWDTSNVDAQAKQAVESSSPIPTRFLETIPASPTTSRSPSPGFPLDLEPPRARSRSRSYSPATSVKDLPRTRVTSPTESMAEAHIHPLFRSDSPTPPPAATPGTVVTAAPGNGQVISDRASLRTASLRSISRMRSGSLPSSPIMHSPSLESIQRAMEKEEREQELQEEKDASIERTLTPPIPDWIMAAAPRNSFTGYNSRKKSTQVGLGIVGEERSG
jgi:hypothetical protein